MKLRILLCLIFVMFATHRSDAATRGFKVGAGGLDWKIERVDFGHELGGDYFYEVRIFSHLKHEVLLSTYKWAGKSEYMKATTKEEEEAVKRKRVPGYLVVSWKASAFSPVVQIAKVLCNFNVMLAPGGQVSVVVAIPPFKMPAKGNLIFQIETPDSEIDSGSIDGLLMDRTRDPAGLKKISLPVR